MNSMACKGARNQASRAVDCRLWRHRQDAGRQCLLFLTTHPRCKQPISSMTSRVTTPAKLASKCACRLAKQERGGSVSRDNKVGPWVVLVLVSLLLCSHMFQSPVDVQDHTLTPIALGNSITEAPGVSRELERKCCSGLLGSRNTWMALAPLVP